MDALAPLAVVLPTEEVAVVGMGRFAVAGPASYSDDWLDPRYTPCLHLHKGPTSSPPGGTPVRAPDARVLRLAEAAGGNVVYIAGADGASY